MPKHLHYESGTQLERCDTVPPRAMTSSDVLMMTVEIAGPHMAQEIFSEVFHWEEIWAPNVFCLVFTVIKPFGELPF